MNIDIETILRKLHSPMSKQEGLDEMAEALSQGCSTATFLGSLERLFSGLRTCLQFDPNQSDIIMKANQVLLEMLPDIQHSDDLEIQFAQLVPAFIENLGNTKAVVRKSTHKCIATYVKISKKLEYVLLNLIHSGLDSQCTRTRQHSMLVVPALISLKPQVVEKCTPEAIELLSRIIKRLRDPQEIVAKTARKLLLELQKCYQQAFDGPLIYGLKNEEDKIICKAVLRNDEDEIQRILSQPSTQGTQSRRNLQDDQRVPSMPTSSYTSSNSLNNNGLKSNTGLQGGKELSIIGKEILQSNSSSHNHHHLMNSGVTSQVGSMQMLDKIITEAKEESRYPKAPNGLYFGFLEEHLIEALNENNQWKERTNSIEAIESKLNVALQAEKKIDFLPYITNFLGFMIEYIPDINFKISLTTIKIISKLLSNTSINFKKHYQLLVTCLIEKLSDSKVVIRQAVLKSCGLLISNYKASTFSYHAMKYLQHGNWHVREGSLTLIAHCIISQTTQQGPKTLPVSPINSLLPQTPDSEVPLPLNTTLIQELCNQIQIEDKQKIQQQMIEVLALLIEKGTEKMRTTNLLGKAFGFPGQFKSFDEVMNYSNTSKESILFKQIIERFQKGNLPYISDDQIVEFPPPTPSGSMHSKMSLIGGSQESQSFKDTDGEFAGISVMQPMQPETFASNLNKLPSQAFMEMKRKQQEEEKKPINQMSRSSLVTSNSKEAPPTDEKIAMWLPNFQVPQNQSSFKMNQGPSNSNKNLRNSQGNSMQKTDNLSSTASSVANFMEDGRSMQSFHNPNTYTEIKNPPDQSSLGGYIGSQPSYMMKSPMYSEGKVYSSMGPNSSLSTNMPSNSTFSSSNIGPSSNMGGANMMGRIGYTPESHVSKPRNISSNEMKQRSMMEGANGQMPGYNYQFNGINDANSNSSMYQGIEYDVSLNLQKNMSHSSGGVGGFGVNNVGLGKGGPQVTDRLKLLKSKQTSSQSADKPRRDFMNNQQEYDEQESIPQFSNNEPAATVERAKGMTSNSGFNQRKLNIQGGPIKGQHQDDILNGNDEYGQEIINQSMTPNIVKTKKPPLTKANANSVSKVPARAQSVDTSINANPSPYPSAGDAQGMVYQPVEEPLINPEKQYQTALDLLRSGDWAKQFEACNIIKRVAIYHKNMLASNHPLQGQVIKELLKVVDSLRSQLSKNSMLCITTIVENIPAKDLDFHLDAMMPPLIKKAADTNIFISESADQALTAICHMLSDSKVFNCLQSQNVRSNPMKVKVAMCYNALIDRLGPKIRQFRDMDRLVQAVAAMMNESGAEVRNMAKIGLCNLKNALGSQRELELMLQRCVTNEKQYEKIKQVIDKSDFESISNTGSTRYGSSMRTSSLDSRSAGPFRANNATQQQTMTSAGSEGFGLYTQSSDFNNSYSKAGNGGGAPSVMTTTGGSQGFNTTSNSNQFKKSSIVSKPVDPMVMDELRNILMELATSDWNKRIKAIDSLSNFIKAQQSTIKQAQPAKFIQLIDAYCKLLTDNNAKVSTVAQQSFKNVLLNPNLTPLIDQNLSMIVQTLNTNLSSTNVTSKDQGEVLFNLLEGCADPNQLLPPMIAQINLANNRSKHLLIERLTSLIERVDKVNLIQKYVQPLFQQSNKIQSEASTNARLKDALQKLSQSTSRILQQA